MSTPVRQIPGCLPKGYTLDSLLTLEQFLVWIQRGNSWFTSHRSMIPGITGLSWKDIRVHPRTYLDKSLKGKVSA